MDRDRILDDFEHCCHGDCYVCGAGVECKYVDHTPEGGLSLMPARLRLKVLALLKEQETVKHGRWEVWQHPGDEVVCNCSVCQTPYSPEELYLGGTEYPNYCPNCGAKIDGEEAI